MARCARRISAVLCVLSALLAVSADASPADARAALDSKASIWLPESIAGVRDAADAIVQQVHMLSKVHLRIGVAALSADQPKLRLGSITGTLREILDKIASATDTTWETNGDWINFTPRGGSPEYLTVMHRVVPGTVVVSPEPAKCTPVRQMLANDHSRVAFIHTLRVFGPDGREFPTPHADLIMMESPRLWEFLNAEQDLWKRDYYEVRLRVTTEQDGKTVRSICVNTVNMAQLSVGIGE